MAKYPSNGSNSSTVTTKNRHLAGKSGLKVKSDHVTPAPTLRKENSVQHRPKKRLHTVEGYRMYNNRANMDRRQNTLTQRVPPIRGQE